MLVAAAFLLSPACDEPPEEVLGEYDTTPAQRSWLVKQLRGTHSLRMERGDHRATLQLDAGVWMNFGCGASRERVRWLSTAHACGNENVPASLKLLGTATSEAKHLTGAIEGWGFPVTKPRRPYSVSVRFSVGTTKFLGVMDASGMRGTATGAGGEDLGGFTAVKVP
ncbi:hypothetical protein [Pyxidicoccus xibeiensis]|uniref:hypothetical protein n=1 Tax=Pyxidicoccus xibeiensis TaxID=2906759 RepID=UPI0020A83059|nr:hypothetical protein [Pyxidicoccus xibeiensis]MCP3140235.1 hypothetical protein [Pyxidicoccus xibeiensis]